MENKPTVVERWKKYQTMIIIVLIGVVVLQWIIFFRTKPEQFNKLLIFAIVLVVGGVILYYILTKKDPNRLLKIGEELIIPAMHTFFGITASMQDVFYKELRPNVYGYQYQGHGRIALVMWDDTKQEIVGHEMKRIDKVIEQQESSDITREIIKEQKVKQREKEELEKKGLALEGEE